MMKFQDVAHLYLGCKGFLPNDDRIPKYNCPTTLEYNILSGQFYGLQHFRPALRLPINMTEDHLKEHVNLAYQFLFGFTTDLIDFEKNESTDNYDIGCVCRTKEFDERLGLNIQMRGVEFFVDSQKLIINQFDHVKLLLSQGYDLFHLIENKESLDADNL